MNYNYPGMNDPPSQQQPSQPQIPYGLLRNFMPGQSGGGLLGGGGGDGGSLGGGGGGGSLGGFGGPSLFAALISMGKNTEANHPDTGLGQGLLGMLGPSISQIGKDPVGMGLPTLFGMPFLTPFTSSKEAQATKPEWSGLAKGTPFGIGF